MTYKNNYNKALYKYLAGVCFLLSCSCLPYHICFWYQAKQRAKRIRKQRERHRSSAYFVYSAAVCFLLSYLFLYVLSLSLSSPSSSSSMACVISIYDSGGGRARLLLAVRPFFSIFSYPFPLLLSSFFPLLLSINPSPLFLALSARGVSFRRLHLFTPSSPS